MSLGLVDFSKTRVEIKSYGGGFCFQKLCRLSFLIFYFRIIIIIILTYYFLPCTFFLIFALLFSSLLSTPFIRFPRYHRVLSAYPKRTVVQDALRRYWVTGASRNQWMCLLFNAFRIFRTRKNSCLCLGCYFIC